MIPFHPIHGMQLSRWLMTIAWMLLHTYSTALAIPPETIDHALRGMYERGLAESAVQYCRAQANLLIESPAARARWTMRQMESQGQAALRSTATDPSALWQLVEQIESDYRREFTDDPRLPWLAWQTARADLLRAQQALAKWLATPAASNQRDLALQAVRKLNSRLDDLEREIKDRIPQAQNRSTQNRAAGKTQAPIQELHELVLDCALLRCESYLVRAKCYPNQSPDYLTALAEVDSTVNEVLRMAAIDWPSRDELLVAQATAGLEVGKRRQAMEVLIRTLQGQRDEMSAEGNQADLKSNPPSELARLRAGVALVEALCSDGQPDQAAEFVSQLTSAFQGPEVDLAALRVELAKMKQMPANSRPEALANIIATTKSLGERYGNYWRNRGEALLVAEASSEPNALARGGSQASHPNATNQDRSNPPPADAPQMPASAQGMTDLLTIEIRQLLAGGQTVAAIAKLRSAITSAESANRIDEALTYALEAARLMQKEKQWSQAAELLAPLAVSHSDAKDAPAAHALAAWCIAQALKGSAAQGVEKQYEDLLREQLARWPDAVETLKGEEYLSAWLTSQKRYEDLCAMWIDRAVLVMDQDRKRLALDHWLSTLLSRLPKPKVAGQIDKLARAIAQGQLATCERTAKIILVAGVMLTTPVTRAEAEQLARIQLPEHELQQPPGDQTLLSALMLLDAVYRDNAVAAGQAAETIELAQMTSIVNLAWCKAVALAADELPAPQLDRWSNVFAAVKMPLQDASTPVLQMTRLRLEQLRASTAAANAAALDQIKQLAQTHSKDPNLQLTLAAATYQSSDNRQPAERFAEAIRLVKRVAVGTKKDSEAHQRARWLEARWQLGRGDPAAASQVAQLMLSNDQIEPAWWKARFQELIKK